jgi:hypothetical protein
MSAMIEEQVLGKWELEIGTLKHTHDCAGNENLKLCRCGLQWRIRLKAALSDIRTFRNALGRYGAHESNCLLLVPRDSRQPDVDYDRCSCGLDNLLAF